MVTSSIIKKDIAPHYQYVFNRLKKLEGAMKNICRRNTELEDANAKLRKEHDTWQQREAARERVLQSLEQNSDKEIHT